MKGDQVMKGDAYLQRRADLFAACETAVREGLSRDTKALCLTTGVGVDVVPSLCNFSDRSRRDIDPWARRVSSQRLLSRLGSFVWREVLAGCFGVVHVSDEEKRARPCEPTAVAKRL